MLRTIRSVKLRNTRAHKFRLAGWHPFAIPLFTFGILFGFTLLGLGFVKLTSADKPKVSDARVVIVSFDDQKQVVPSRERTVGGLIKRLNITLGEGDRIEPALSAKIDQDDFRINIYRALPVQVVDGNRVVTTYSAATTPRSIAEQADAKIFPEDSVRVDPVQDFIATGAIGERVTIDRATPVNLNLYGEALALRTQAKTVGDLVAQKKITLNEGDELTPSADTPLTPQTQVFVTRNGIKIESVTEDIPTPVQRISDPNLAYGTNAVRQQGSPGKRVTTYQNTLRNDQVVSRTVLQTVVTQEPVTQIEVVGTSISGIKGDMARAGIAPEDYTYVDYIVSKESGWRPFARNASSGAYGLCQALPGTKMASAGADWETNPVTQLRWCDGYAKARYGSWARAYSFWLANKYW